MTNRGWAVTILSAALAVGWLPGVARADESADKPAKTKKARPFKGRLPNNWSKLNITDEQREKIYATQVGARPKLQAKQKEIDQLSAELDKLRDELEKMQQSLRDEMHAILTEEQRNELVNIEAEAKKQRAAKKKDAASKESG